MGENIGNRELGGEPGSLLLYIILSQSKTPCYFRQTVSFTGIWNKTLRLFSSKLARKEHILFQRESLCRQLKSAEKKSLWDYLYECLFWDARIWRYCLTFTVFRIKLSRNCFSGQMTWLPPPTHCGVCGGPSNLFVAGYHQRIQGALGAWPPLPPRFFFQNHSVFRQFQGKNPYFEQILGFGGPPWGQNSAGPPWRKSWIGVYTVQQTGTGGRNSRGRFHPLTTLWLSWLHFSSVLLPLCSPSWFWLPVDGACAERLFSRDSGTSGSGLISTGASRGRHLQAHVQWLFQPLWFYRAGLSLSSVTQNMVVVLVHGWAIEAVVFLCKKLQSRAGNCDVTGLGRWPNWHTSLHLLGNHVTWCKSSAHVWQQLLKSLDLLLVGAVPTPRLTLPLHVRCVAHHSGGVSQIEDANLTGLQKLSPTVQCIVFGGSTNVQCNQDHPMHGVLNAHWPVFWHRFKMHRWCPPPSNLLVPPNVKFSLILHWCM